MKKLYLCFLPLFVCLSVALADHGKKPPKVENIKRYSPGAPETSASSVTFRVSFSEVVFGVDPGAFELKIVSGNIKGSIAANAVRQDFGNRARYYVTVSSLTGNGVFRLDLAKPNKIVSGSGTKLAEMFQKGETYTLRSIIPTLTSVTIASNNPTPVLAKPGDIVTVKFKASMPIQIPAVTIAGKTAFVFALGGDNYRASRIMQSPDAPGVIPFKINFSSITGTTGEPVTATTNGSQVVFDKTAPTVTSINRQIPLTETITATTSATFRVTFSEKIRGLNKTDFTLTVTNGTVSGSLTDNAVTPVGKTGKTYDVKVSSLIGSGRFRLDLKNNGTGIADVAGNGIATGFNTGQHYTLSQSAPALTSVTIASNNLTPSLAKPGDIVTVKFTASIPIKTPAVTIAGKAAIVSPAGGNSFTASCQMLSTNAPGVVPFTINFTGANRTAGAPVATTTNGSKVTFDKTAPQVSSINRQTPLTEAITGITSVTFRTIFSEKITGPDKTDFALAVTSGSVSGIISTVTPVGNAGTTYDIAVSSLTGTGSFRLNLKSTGTGIKDPAGNAITTGFTSGQPYVLTQTAPVLTLVTIASNNLTPSLAKPGDIVTVKFTASIPIKTPAVMIAGKAAIVSPAGGNSFTASCQVQSTDASGVLPFTIHFAGTNGTAGGPVATTTNGSKVTFDKTAPQVSSINRQTPLTEAITGITSVTFRTIFSEKITGPDKTDFALTVTSGSVSGIISTVTPVGNAGTTYDITVSSLTGSGSFRLNLKSAGTGIADAAGNTITTGFNTGQHYTLTQPVPVLTSVGIASNDPAPALAKPGDIVTVKFTASIPINTPTATIAGKAATIGSAGSNNFTASYTMQSTDATGIVPFVINFASTAGPAGSPVSTTTNGSQVVFDKTAPTVTSINRQSPLTEAITGATAVTFRTTFSEKITGLDKPDLALTVTSGSVIGIISNVTPVGNAGTTYDIAVSSLSSSGSFRLDLKNTGTGIADAAGNAITTGFNTGQQYLLTQPTPPQPGFKTIISLAPVNMLTQETKDKPQAKTWTYAGKWWSVLAVDGATRLYRLDGKSWKEQLTLHQANSKPDCWIAGDMAHILVYKGALHNTYLYSLQFDAIDSTYKLWNMRPTGTALAAPEGSQTATLVMDGKGRIWAATDGLADIKVWYSDAPYTQWSVPVTIASNVKDDDICELVAMPSLGKIGIFWSNQVSKKFGFRTHTDGTAPSTWSGDEMPAAAAALDNIGSGFADNHMSAKVGADGTVYLASKTSYETDGYAKLILLVRRPAGVWDNPYAVTKYSEGTQPCLLLNETKKKLKVVYTTVENGGDVLYRESSTDNISFSEPLPLFKSSGVLFNFATSTHQNYTSSVVIFATNVTAVPNQAVSVIASDDDLVLENLRQGPLSEPKPDNPIVMGAYPNPSTGAASIRFALPTASQFSLDLYDSRGTKLKTLQTGWAPAGVTNTVPLTGIRLPEGSYMVHIRAGNRTQVIQILVRH